MALVLAAVPAVIGLIAANRHFQKEAHKRAEKKDHADYRLTSTGAYGDTAQISELLGDPGFISHQEVDVDLTGVPYRWIVLKNGCKYRTYDMHTPFVQ